MTKQKSLILSLPKPEPVMACYKSRIWTVTVVDISVLPITFSINMKINNFYQFIHHSYKMQKDCYKIIIFQEF